MTPARYCSLYPTGDAEAAGLVEAVAATFDLRSFVDLSNTACEFDSVARRQALTAA
jgi:hypothetical protein